MFSNKLLDLDHLQLATDEGSQLQWQVVRNRFQRAQRRELPPQLRMQNLKNVLQRRQVTQPNFTEIAQLDPFREAVAHQDRHGLREQHLTAVGNAHDACSAVHGTAEEIAVPALL